MHSLTTKECKQFMQWWPVTWRHSWSNVLCSGHIRTYSSCRPQPVSGGKSDLFDSTWVWLGRCYIYSRRAVKFFRHTLEKTLGYVTVRISISRSKDGARAEKREVVQGHRRLRGLSHSKAAIHSLSLGLEIWVILMPPLSSRKGGRGKEDRLAHTDIHRNPPKMKPWWTYDYRAPPTSAVCLHFWVQAVWTLQMMDCSVWDRASCVCVCVFYIQNPCK